MAAAHNIYLNVEYMEISESDHEADHRQTHAIVPVLLTNIIAAMWRHRSNARVQSDSHTVCKQTLSLSS